jgi:hypothetical protein
MILINYHYKISKIDFILYIKIRNKFVKKCKKAGADLNPPFPLNISIFPLQKIVLIIIKKLFIYYF